RPELRLETPFGFKEVRTGCFGVAAQAQPCREELRWKRRSARELDVACKVGLCPAVQLPLILEPCLFVAAASRHRGSQSLGQKLGVAERVADTERQIRIFVTGGVSDERPPRAVWPSQVVRQRAGAENPLFTLPCPYPLRELGDRIQHLQQVLLWSRSEGLEFPNRPGHEHGEQVIVGREREDHTTVAQVELERIACDAAPVGEVPARKGRCLVVGRCPNGPRNTRVPSIG